MYNTDPRTVHSDKTRLAVFSVPFPQTKFPNVFVPGRIGRSRFVMIKIYIDTSYRIKIRDRPNRDTTLSRVILY